MRAVRVCGGERDPGSVQVADGRGEEHGGGGGVGITGRQRGG